MRNPGSELRVVVEAINQDLRDVGLNSPLDVWDPGPTSWVLEPHLDAGPEGFSEDSYVAAIEGSLSMIGTVVSGPDLVDLVSFVQDWAIDCLGFGWPELVDEDGEFLGLLEPVELEGGLVWRSGDCVVEVGLLGSARIRTRA